MHCRPVARAQRSADDHLFALGRRLVEAAQAAAIEDRMARAVAQKLGVEPRDDRRHHEAMPDEAAREKRNYLTDDSDPEPVARQLPHLADVLTIRFVFRLPVFGDETVSMDRIAKSIATQRTELCASKAQRSPFFSRRRRR